MGLFDFLFGRRGGERNAERNGASHETAIVVGSVGEEYVWMQRHYPGFKPVRQALHETAGKHYDELTWRNAKGEEIVVYFDISGFFGR